MSSFRNAVCELYIGIPDQFPKKRGGVSPENTNGNQYARDTTRTTPLLLGNNIVKKNITQPQWQQKSATVSSYNEGSGLHTVTYGDKSTAVMDLNISIGKGTCSTPLSLTTAFERLWRTKVFSQVPAHAARSKPKGKADPR